MRERERHKEEERKKNAKTSQDNEEDKLCVSREGTGNADRQQDTQLQRRRKTPRDFPSPRRSEAEAGQRRGSKGRKRKTDRYRDIEIGINIKI